MSATNELFSQLNIIEKINTFIHIDDISNFREDICLKAISSNNVLLQIFQSKINYKILFRKFL